MPATIERALRILVWSPIIAIVLVLLAATAGILYWVFSPPVVREVPSASLIVDLADDWKYIKVYLAIDAVMKEAGFRFYRAGPGAVPREEYQGDPIHIWSPDLSMTGVPVWQASWDYEEPTVGRVEFVYVNEDTGALDERDAEVFDGVRCTLLPQFFAGASIEVVEDAGLSLEPRCDTERMAK